MEVKTFLFLLSILVVGCGQYLSQTEGVLNKMDRVGKASDFTLRAISGEDISLFQYAGKVVLLHFFSVGCKTCAKEAQGFQSEIVSKDLSRDCVVLGISVKNEASKVLDWKNANGITYPILLDSEGLVFEKYKRSDAIPTLVYLDRNQVISEVEDFYLGLAHVIEKINSLVSSNSAALFKPQDKNTKKKVMSVKVLSDLGYNAVKL